MRRTYGIMFGCFDLLHVGHVRALKFAKSKCDHLTVGLFTDEAIESYKFAKPIVPFDQRMEMLLALDCTDAVIKVKERSALNVNADMLFVERRRKKLYMADKNFNGKIYYVPRTENVSSWKIKEKCFVQKLKRLQMLNGCSD
jgi:glycerol-3-phosphate cytidylyltransferase